MGDATIPNNKPQQNGALPALPDFKKLLREHSRASSAVKEYFQPFLSVTPAFAQGPTPEADRARFDRIFRPWPKWVFKLGAELWHVDYPTINREVFYETFRVVNALFFRLSGNWKKQIATTTRRDVFDRIDFRVVPLIIAAFVGHAFEHSKAYRNKLDEQLAKGEISPEEHKKQTEANSEEKIDEMMRKLMGQWSKSDNVKPFQITETVENARRKTFDKNGLPKESPLIPTYRLMLHNWITIENMSGPKELTHFLLTGKGNTDFYAEHDRIKKTCSRLGVKFKKVVKHI